MAACTPTLCAYRPPLCRSAPLSAPPPAFSLPRRKLQYLAQAGMEDTHDMVASSHSQHFAPRSPALSLGRQQQPPALAAACAYLLLPGSSSSSWPGSPSSGLAVHRAGDAAGPNSSATHPASVRTATPGIKQMYECGCIAFNPHIGDEPVALMCRTARP
eukprot:COSAG04_NODE_13772_length_592_cov_1.452333_1_plen_158_part_10